MTTAIIPEASPRSATLMAGNREASADVLTFLSMIGGAINQVTAALSADVGINTPAQRKADRARDDFAP